MARRTRDYSADNSKVKDIGDVAKGGGIIMGGPIESNPVTSKKAKSDKPTPTKEAARVFQNGEPRIPGGMGSAHSEPVEGKNKAI